MSVNWRPRGWLGIMVAIAGALALFVSAEWWLASYREGSIGARSLAHQEIYRDEQLAGRIAEDQSRLVTEAYPYVMHRTGPDQHTVTFNVNSLGFRGREVLREKLPGTVRLAIVGGSVAWGAGASSDGTTIAGDLQQRLNDAGIRSARFEVINAADSGYQTAQNLIVVWDRVLDLDPDVIIALDGYNDAYAGILNREAGFPQNFRDFKRRLEVRRAWALLLRAAEEVVQASNVLRQIGATVRRIREPGGDSANYAKPTEVARIFGRNLEALFILAHARGIATLFVLQPALGLGGKRLTRAEQNILSGLERYIPGYGAYLQTVYPLLQAQLERLHRTRGARVLDLVGVFSGVGHTIFYDGCHFGDEGHRRVAEKIHAELAPTLLALPAARRRGDEATVGARRSGPMGKDAGRR